MGPNRMGMLGWGWQMKVKRNGAESLASYQTAHAPILPITTTGTTTTHYHYHFHYRLIIIFMMLQERNRNLLHHKLGSWGRSGDGGWCGWVVFEIMLITSHDPDIRAARVLGSVDNDRPGMKWGRDGMAWDANANADRNNDGDDDGDGDVHVPA